MRRKIFLFQANEQLTGVLTANQGWGNEKKIVWDSQPDNSLEILEEDDESAFPEGKERYLQHRSLERDPALVRKAKEKRIANTGKLECDVCKFDFNAEYGNFGSGFIEAHHTIPISTLDGNIKTRAGPATKARNARAA